MNNDSSSLFLNWIYSYLYLYLNPFLLNVVFVQAQHSIKGS